MATPLDQLPSASPLERYKATRGNQAQRQQFLTDLAQSDPWGSDYLQRYIQLASDVHAQGTFEQAGIALPGHSPAALGPTTPGPADEPSRVEAAQHSMMQLQDRQMSNMGYSAWRQAREAADGPDDWVAPGGPDAGEQQGEGPMWDRLVQMSESDDPAASIARLRVRMARDFNYDDAKREAQATKYFNDTLSRDDRMAVVQSAARLQQIGAEHGDDSPQMAAALEDLQRQVDAATDPAVAAKLDQQLTMFTDRHLAGQTVDSVLAKMRRESEPELTEAEHRDAEFRANPSRFEGVPPPNQEGRGELQPSLVAKAAQNLRENPLAAQMYGQRLLSATQTADTAAMARVNHEVYAQQARDGVRGIRRRQRPNGKVDWSKRRIARPSKA